MLIIELFRQAFQAIDGKPYMNCVIIKGRVNAIQLNNALYISNRLISWQYNRSNIILWRKIIYMYDDKK